MAANLPTAAQTVARMTQRDCNDWSPLYAREEQATHLSTTIRAWRSRKDALRLDLYACLLVLLANDLNLVCRYYGLEARTAGRKDRGIATFHRPLSSRASAGIYVRRVTVKANFPSRVRARYPDYHEDAPDGVVGLGFRRRWSICAFINNYNGSTRVFIDSPDIIKSGRKGASPFWNTWGAFHTWKEHIFFVHGWEAWSFGSSLVYGHVNLKASSSVTILVASPLAASLPFP
ncbi:uncharacterized protein EV420DRAFT_1645591 [Desarmillaria tabescens]|uniref:Uncharacterized protein n=1 Tax=Armillaria tabescens TaxID=1929756 RepID=A0AA39K3K8_ARMTA|nr:uncharacterized protein EV420DRAFT_1645591 [Desarmillaria tabescens]KAK0452741.1 hypothetical protein EV420DRAFT_1645591 [Desarmillaria tabescens]